MNHSMPPRTPRYQHGQMSPPAISAASINAQSQNGTPPPGFPQMNPAQTRMALYYSGPQVESPMPIAPSPYIMPKPPQNLDEDPDDKDEYLEWKRQKMLKKWEQEQRSQPGSEYESPPRQYSPAQQQTHSYYGTSSQQFGQDQHQQQPHNSPPPPRQYSQSQPPQQYQQEPPPREYSQSQQSGYDPSRGYSQYQQLERRSSPSQNSQYSQQQSPYTNPLPLATLPPHMLHNAPRHDSGYGSMDSYGMPYQPQFPMAPRSHTFAARPGHSYGKITARGPVKILMGNVTDGMRPTGFEKIHNYGDADIDGASDIITGDVNGDQMRNFFHRPAQLQNDSVGT